jgi:hypothetical protein
LPICAGASERYAVADHEIDAASLPVGLFGGTYKKRVARKYGVKGVNVPALKA